MFRNPFTKAPGATGQKKPPRLHQLLGSKDERVQVQRVQSLAGAPMVTLTIVCDLRDGFVDVAVLGDRGGGLPANVIYNMLDQARRILMAREMRPAPNQAPPSAPPAAPPVPDDPFPLEGPASGPPGDTAPPFPTDPATDPH